MRGSGQLRPVMEGSYAAAALALNRLVGRHPVLAPCVPDITAAFELLRDSFRSGGWLLVCGNGGSAADSEHIVGELMKGFNLSRPLSPVQRQALVARYGPEGEGLAAGLQGALPAISLVSQSSLLTAYSNDVAADMAFAQQVYGYGQPGDALLALSTSGNSRNVIHAVQVAVALGMHTVGLTGANGGRLADLCEVVIRMPVQATDDVQELHLPVYHALCTMLEQTFFAPDQSTDCDSMP